MIRYGLMETVLMMTLERNTNSVSEPEFTVTLKIIITRKNRVEGIIIYQSDPHPQWEHFTHISP